MIDTIVGKDNECDVWVVANAGYGTKRITVLKSAKETNKKIFGG